MSIKSKKNILVEKAMLDLKNIPILNEEKNFGLFSLVEMESWKANGWEPIAARSLSAITHAL